MRPSGPACFQKKAGEGPGWDSGARGGGLLKGSKVARKPGARGKKSEPRKRAPAARPPAQEKAIEEFAAALKLFHRRDLARARDHFRQVLATYPQEKEIGDRATTYLRVCERGLQPQSPRLKDADDFYYQGVVLLNQRNIEEAIRMFERALASDPASEKALYASAAALALSGRRAECLSMLSRAIEAGSSNRVRAANESDFDSMRDDPEFRRLVHGDGGSPE